MPRQGPTPQSEGAHITRDRSAWRLPLAMRKSGPVRPWRASVPTAVPVEITRYAAHP